MSKETREHISCLMDGEVSREASRFLVRRLGSDIELSATWARYHLVRDCLRNQDGGIAQEDLGSRVSRALENEEVATPRLAVSRWLRPVAGAAIAASVALVAVMAVGPGAVPVQQAPGDIADNSATQPFSSPQGYSHQAATQPASLVSAEKMNSYLLRHYQAAGAGGRGFVGIVPFVVTQGDAVSEPVDGDVEDASENAPESNDGR